MSFVKFLGTFAKIVFGLGGGLLLIVAGVFMFAQGQEVLGVLIWIAGVIVALFGVYNKRQL